MGELVFAIRVKDDGSAVVERFGSNVQKTGKAVGQTAGRMTRAFGAVRGGISRTLGSIFNLRNAIIGLGAVAAIRTVVKSFADFETQMNRVRVLTGATGKDFMALENLARELGRTTAFSAKQSADAMGFLSMAGFEVDEVMSALPETLKLAAAAQLELGEAADIVTNILTGLQIPMEDLGKANDVLVKAFTSTNTNLQQLGQAFKFVGPVTTSAGLAFEEVTAALGLLGNAGIQASMAGTTLRGAIAKLLNPSAEGAKVLAELGVEAIGTTGKMNPLSDIIEQLAEGGATTADIFKIFGQRAGPGIAALLSQGSKAIKDLTRTLEDSAGVAERAAEIQLEGLNGSLIKMKSAAEGAAISIGESLAPFVAEGADVIRELAGAATEAVAAITVSIGTTKGFGETLRSFMPTANTLVRGFFIMARAIEVVKIAFKAMDIAISGIAITLNLLFGQVDRARLLGTRVKELAAEIKQSAENLKELSIQEELATRAQAERNRELAFEKELGSEIARGRKEILRIERLGRDVTNEQIDQQFKLRRQQKELEKDLDTFKTTEFTLIKIRGAAVRKEREEEAQRAREFKQFKENEATAIKEIAELRSITAEEAKAVLRFPEGELFKATVEDIVNTTTKFLDKNRKDMSNLALATGATSQKAVQAIGDISQTGAESISATLARVDQESQQRILQDLARFKGTEDQKLRFVKQRVRDQIAFERGALVEASASLFGALASLAETGGEKQFKLVKKFQIAEAITSGILAVQRTLASLPFPANVVAAAAIAAQTIANVRRIQQAKPGGGAGGAGGFSAPGVGGQGGPGTTGMIEGPAMGAQVGGLQEVNISVAGFVGDEATLASEIGRVLREAEGDGVQVNVAT